jgi:ABC-type cobalamin/Fe3+-siderophores transport system ATPase subunit
VTALDAPAPLRADAVSVALGGATIVRNASLELAAGSVTALVGPNGSGKSTLLRALARVLKPQAGSVLLDGRELHEQPTAAVARRLAYLPQDAATSAGLTVRGLVELGRRPHLGRFGFLRPADHEAVDWALAATGLEALAGRRADTLSGGERQRAWLGLALAQRTSLLLLDEPTTFLDVRHQLDVLTLVRRLNAEHGLTVCWVLHDLNAAAAFSDAMVWLRDGRVLAAGPPDELLTPDLVRRVFDVDAAVVPDPRTGRPVCLPMTAGADHHL